MSHIKRYRPTPAMVVALVALVFAMTGWATAQVPNPLPLQDPPPAPQVQEIQATGTGFAIARCPDGWVATGGGGAAAGGLDQSQPTEFATAWVAGAINPAAFVVVDVVCMRF